MRIQQSKVSNKIKKSSILITKDFENKTSIKKGGRFVYEYEVQKN